MLVDGSPGTRTRLRDYPNFHIPDSIARSLRIPEAEAETRSREELAVALYSQAFSPLAKRQNLPEDAQDEQHDSDRQDQELLAQSEVDDCTNHRIDLRSPTVDI